ncbi:MAG: hypothetical protein R3Y53_09765 [Bacillota bacterium]
MQKTLREFFTDIANISYELGDFASIQNHYKDMQITKFLDCFIKGAEIASNGENQSAVAIKGIAEQDKGTTGEEMLHLHDFQLYDYSDTDGKWFIVTFFDLPSLESYLLSEAGYLNYYSTQMLVFENGVQKPFEILFHGNHGKTIVIDKDQINAPLDIKKMQEQMEIRWLTLEDLLPLTDEDVEAFKKSLAESK